MRMVTPALIGLAVLLAVGVSGSGATRQDSPEAKEKLRQAEQLADRFVARFARTLDFGVVYREMFVRDRKLRRRNLDWFVSKDLLAHLDDPAIEEAYIAMMNTTYLSWLYTLNRPAGFGEDDKELHWPRDVKDEIKRTLFNRCRFLDRDADCEKLGEAPFKTKRDLTQFIYFSNRLSVLFRKHIPRRPFASRAYKRNVRDIVWNGMSSEINDGDHYFEIPEGTPVLEMSRGMFRFQMVEEHGVLRIFNLHLFQ